MTCHPLIQCFTLEVLDVAALGIDSCVSVLGSLYSLKNLLVCSLVVSINLSVVGLIHQVLDLRDRVVDFGQVLHDVSTVSSSLTLRIELHEVVLVRLNL